MKLISADLDRSRAEVTISIDIGQTDADGNVVPYVLTYGTDPRGENETAQEYRKRVKDWLKTVRREARLMADLEARKFGPPPARDDVLADVAPAFV